MSLSYAELLVTRETILSMYVCNYCMYVCMFVFMFVCMTLQGTKGLKAFETVNMMP